MGKKRIYELAKELNVPSKQLIAQAQQLGFSVKNHMSTLGDSEARQLQGTTTVTHPKSQPAPAKTSRATQAVAKNVTRTATKAELNTATGNKRTVYAITDAGFAKKMVAIMTQ
ncbi:hypothetical protein WP50_19880 [Lactiplantibacillus plantarum]|nr:hypothetical protein WP50_19880 [Lactiplantibacillus plantarum]